MPTRAEFLANGLLSATDAAKCSICFQQQQANGPATHVFCSECITMWLTNPRVNSCPTCRQHLFDLEPSSNASASSEVPHVDHRLEMRRYREQMIQTLRDRQPAGTDPNAIVFDNDMIVDRDFLMAMRGDIRDQRLLGDHFGDDDQYWDLWGFVLFTLDVPEESPWRDTDQLGRLEDALVLIREEMERFRTHVMYRYVRSTTLPGTWPGDA